MHTLERDGAPIYKIMEHPCMISYKMTWKLCGTENLIWFQAKNNNFILSLNPTRLKNNN